MKRIMIFVRFSMSSYWLVSSGTWMRIYWEKEKSIDKKNVRQHQSMRFVALLWLLLLMNSSLVRHRFLDPVLLEDPIEEKNLSTGNSQSAHELVRWTVSKSELCHWQSSYRWTRRAKVLLWCWDWRRSTNLDCRLLLKVLLRLMTNIFVVYACVLSLDRLCSILWLKIRLPKEHKKKLKIQRKNISNFTPLRSWWTWVRKISRRRLWIYSLLYDKKPKFRKKKTSKMNELNWLSLDVAEEQSLIDRDLENLADEHW